MHSFASLPLLLVLVAQASLLAEALATTGPHRRGMRLPRLVRRVQAGATQQTRSLARDLRTALGAVLPRAEEGYYGDQRPVVYCKSKKKKDDGRPNDENMNDPPYNPPDGDYGGNGTSPTGTATRGPSSRTRTSGSKPTPPPNNDGPSSPWRLSNSYEGGSFFEDWDFFTSADPTHGIVDYINEDAGRAAGLVEINGAGNAIMRVETTPTVPGNRRSIRITTKATFNSGALFILDAVHMPVGCGTWPAFWTNGPNWPVGGEIDILEGVHEYSNNQATLHTSSGCRIASGSSDELGISGKVIAGTNCNVAETSNQGCGIRADTRLSYGKGFNENGGGVYAMQWDESGISIYFFPRGSIPSDIQSEKPNPDGWGLAQARWPASGCDPFKYFSDQHAIFTSTLCGDWAGGVWNSAGIPGQEESCAQRTGFATCDEYVRRNGAAFAEAYWEVRNVKIYQPRN